MACRHRVGRSLKLTPVLLGLLAFALTAPPAITAQSGNQRLPDPQIPEFDRQAPARDDVPAHVAVVDGAASIERDGRRDVLEENVLLLAGDRLRTERGRVEVLFDDGSVLDVDEFTTVDLFSDTLLRLTGGRIRLSIARVTNTLNYRVDAAGTTSWIQNAGEYRIAIRNGRATTPEVELSVFRGQAELETTHGTTTVRTGAQAFAVSSSAPSQSYAVNVAIVDDFDRWAEGLRDTRLGDDSARYLPAELRYYGGALDESGYWGNEPSYGAVWYPRVDAGWRPYYHGNWSFYGSFGWTWVGGPRWAWPTHHYGRWGYSNKWYWIPGRRWAPAYVSWGYYPGYVSWCPLGYTGYPVVPIVHANYFVVDPWVAWTAVPSRSFAHGFRPAHYAVAQPVIAKPVWSQFAVRNTAPTGPPAGTPGLSRTAPLRSPTYAGQAVSRDSAPGSGTVANGSRVAPQPFRAATDANGVTRVRPEGTAPSRTATAPPNSPAYAPDDAAPGRATSSRTPTADRQTVTRGSAVERSRAAAPPAPPSDPAGVQESREVMAPPSRTPSRSPGFYRDDPPTVPRSRVYGAPSPPVERNEPAEARGSAVPRSAPPSSAPGGVSRYAPGGYQRPAPTESSRPAPGGYSRTPAGASRSGPEAAPPPPSRVQPRSGPPQAQPAPPSSSGQSGGTRSAPPPSAGTGRAVSRGGGR